MSANEIPAEIWQHISRLPGNDTAGALEFIYGEATRCTGIAIVVNPSVRTAMTVVLGMQASSAHRAPARTYLVDTRRSNLAELLREFATQNLAGEVTFYHGGIEDFFGDLPLMPELLCIDDDSTKLNLTELRGHLRAGTQVLVRTADAGHCRIAVEGYGKGVTLSAEARVLLQGRLHERYFLSTKDGPTDHTPVADLTEEIRGDFSRRYPSVSGYGEWPHVNPEPCDLPGTLPSHREWPKISIITPSFNQGRYIEETIHSVLNQGYPNFEHIIVDGGSTDETLEILGQYRERVAHVISEPDNGQSHAINKGMALASGQILTWLNSDDRLAPGALASIALAFESSGADMVAGICRLYRDGECVQQHLTACDDGPLPLENLLDLDGGWNAGQFFYQPEVMFTRELWLRAGGYVNDWLHYSMDYELWLRFAEVGAKLHVIGRPVAWFRLHDAQKTHVTERFQAELIVVRDGFLKTREHAKAANVKTGPSRSTLRITFFNDHGPFFGAGIAHARLARAAARAGHAVTLVSIVDRPKYDREVPVYTVESVLERISATRPDLVVVGNLHNAAVEPLLLNFLCERFPTLVVMHDFWILTGRCAYTGDCEKYLTGCDETCPTADEYPALAPAEIADAWKKKRLLLQAEKRPALLANSEWVASVARETLGKDSEGAPSIERVHLSFPLDVFRPRNRRDCREQFQLPQNAFIVLLPASLQDSRKGGRRFLAALERLGLPNLLVVALGPTTEGIETTVPLRQLGFVTDPYQIARLNSAADVVVVASSAETFGQVCIESIACGTPAVAFPVSGVREALNDGVTGVLAADMDPASLAAAVQQLYNRPDLRRDISRWGRLYVENEWSEFSAYRHFFLALCANGLAGSLGLRRNLSFLPGEPAAPPLESVWQSKSRWIPRRGFSWKSEAAEYGLNTFWWAHGPSALAEIFAETAGLHHVLISYRNPNPGHRLTLRCNGDVRGVYELPQTGAAAGRLLVLDTRLESGSNLMHFEFSDRFSKAENPESGNIMITEILVEAAAPSVRDFCYGDRPSEKVLNGVWGNAEC